MDKGTNFNARRPITIQGDLAKLPRALKPLLELPQWGVWRWTPEAGRWSKPPFQSLNPDQHLSTKEPKTWSSYADALAAVRAEQAEGISFILTPDGNIAASDLDHCRDPGTGSLSEWAQDLIDQTDSYVEVTPSGTGLRIIGIAIGERLHRKFELSNSGKSAALELFRKTHKAITVTGLELGRCRQLGNIDRLLNRAAIWAEANKCQPEAAPAGGFASNGASPYSVDEIDRIIREGVPDGANRSNVFHMIVGHLCGCGWNVERIVARLEQFPDGIASRYIGENRLSSEVARSFEKYRAPKIIGDCPPWTGGWQEPASTEPELEEDEEPLEDESVPENQSAPEDEPVREIDWTAIETVYRESATSIREIARRHRVSEGAIRKRALYGNWKRVVGDGTQEGVHTGAYRVRTAGAQERVRISGDQKQVRTNGTQEQVRTGTQKKRVRPGGDQEEVRTEEPRTRSSPERAEPVDDEESLDAGDAAASDEDEPDDDEEDAQPDPKLPPMYAHGDPDPRPIRSWLIKRLLPQIGHGLISGQWGTFKTFIALDAAACVMTGQPFLNRMVSRQSGVLFIAAEGAGEVRLRINAVVREKCATPRAPFRWYEVAPTLLKQGAVETLVAMAKQAEASLQHEFGLPLGLILIDTIAASAGYNEVGAENDNAVGQAVMNALNQVAQQMKCCVLGVDHFGKNINAGTRGGSAKESSAEVVLAVLGTRETSGRVVDTRVALRKVRGAQQGEEFYFTVRSVEDPQPDEDGEPISTLVIEWQSGPSTASQAKPEADPWQDCRRGDQQTVVARLKRVLMAVLAEQGVELPTAPDGPVVRMVDCEVVRKEFYMHTVAEGPPEQKQHSRYMQFKRAIDWAERQQLIGIRTIDDITYLWLARINPQNDDEEV